MKFRNFDSRLFVQLCVCALRPFTRLNFCCAVSFQYNMADLYYQVYQYYTYLQRRERSVFSLLSHDFTYITWWGLHRIHVCSCIVVWLIYYTIHTSVESTLICYLKFTAYQVMVKTIHSTSRSYAYSRRNSMRANQARKGRSLLAMKMLSKARTVVGRRERRTHYCCSTVVFCILWPKIGVTTTINNIDISRKDIEKKWGEDNTWYIHGMEK